jgi:hypothetical protein
LGLALVIALVIALAIAVVIAVGQHYFTISHRSGGSVLDLHDGGNKSAATD